VAGDVAGSDSADSVLSDWRQWVDWSESLEIRGDGASSSFGSGGASGAASAGQLQLPAGRRVVPLGVNEDGTLRVRDLATGREETLAADYLM
jgi:hypothetical protein